MKTRHKFSSMACALGAGWRMACSVGPQVRGGRYSLGALRQGPPSRGVLSELRAVKARGKPSGGASWQDQVYEGTTRDGGSALEDDLANRMQRFAADEILLFEPWASRDGASSSDSISTNIVYAYPNTYTVGITSLGYQLVWAALAQVPGVDVRRRFTDAADPLRGREDLIGFSLSWELDFSNMIDMLEQLHVPVIAADRKPGDPFVFGGGAVLSANPEPYADFFDVVLLGDAEQMLPNFISTYQACVGVCKSCDLRREDILASLASVEGVYVPSLFKASYLSPTGPLKSVEPTRTDVPGHVMRSLHLGDRLASSTVISPHMAWESIFMVEVVRSCPEMCRFCLASYNTLPFRPASLRDGLLPVITRGLEYTDRLGLLGASVTQHPEFSVLLAHLTEDERFANVRLSIASVRTNTVEPELCNALSRMGTRSLTVAVESGSARMRAIVNKKLDDSDIDQAALTAQTSGLRGLKLYAMVGLPGETDADVQATLDMAIRLKSIAPGLKITLGCSTFVPKAGTPFQWRGVDPAAEGRLKYLEKQLRKKGIDFRPESYKWSLVQALLSRGDRRVGRILLKIREYGDQSGSLSAFRRAFKDLEGQLPPMHHYVHSTYDPNDPDWVLPWVHIRGTISEETLKKHLAVAETLMGKNFDDCLCE